MTPVGCFYRFEFFDVPSRRWIRARYRAEIETIAPRYAAFRIVGEPEVRELGGSDQLTAGHIARGPKPR